uniref:SDR family oxidoreductase n=1 Tax=Nocardia wallacei TaxID=480035 RepID=UPI002458D08C
QEGVDPRTEPRPGFPLGRPGDAREVAAVVAFLATPAAGYVTGAADVVAGGLLRMGPPAAATPGPARPGARNYWYSATSMTLPS